MAAIFIKRIGDRYVSTDEATALMATAAKFGIAIPEGYYEPQESEFGFPSPMDNLRRVIGENEEAKKWLRKTFGAGLSGETANAIIISNAANYVKDEFPNNPAEDLDTISRIAYTMQQARKQMAMLRAAVTANNTLSKMEA